jgi:hypothetical protein
LKEQHPHKFFKAILILCIIAASHVTTFGQFSSFVQYDMDKGMPSNTAYFVLKDADGYLWITTDKGVVKYDGYDFTTYTTRDGLSDNEVFEGYQDSKKRIWFSTLSGIPTVYSNGSFVNFEHIAKLIETESTGPCYRIIETPYGIYFLNRRAIYRYDDNRVCKISSNGSYFTSIGYHPKSKLLYTVMSGRRKLLTIDSKNRIDSFPVPIQPGSNISKILIKGDKLMYTSWHTFSIVDLEKKNTQQFEFDSELLTVVNTNNDSTVLIGSADYVAEFNLYRNTWKYKFRDQPGVTCIYTGPDRSYWATSLNTGINFFGNEKVEVLSDKNVLPFKYITLVRKIGHRLLITSDKFRLCIYNLHTQKVEYYFDESGKIPGRGFASTIRVANNGDIYVSFRVLLMKIDTKGNVTRIPLKQVSYDLIYTPQYYFCLHTDLFSRRLSTASITALSDDYESMEVNARHLFLDPESHRIFAYGSAGLFKLNTDSFNRVRNYSNVEELKSNISAMVKLGKDFYAVGSTVSGLHFLNNNKVMASISVEGGLSSNYVSCVTLDKNELWIGTDHGINVLNLDTRNGKYELKILGKKDGIFSDEINDIYIDQDTVFASSPTGLFIFKKNDIIRSPETPVLNIDYIKFGTSLAKPGHDYRSTQEVVRVKYTGISYNSQGNMVYRYKLAPVDDEWHYTSSREIEYPSLRPNFYTLTIQCKGGSGNWSEEKMIRFEIVPFFWQRVDVQICIAFLLVATSLILIWVRIRALKRQNRIQQKLLRLENEKLEITKNKALQEKEIIELEQQALRLHMNPHFIFNAINAIQGFYAGNEVDKAKQFISYFSKLLRMILETSKEKLIPVNLEIDIIKSYLELFLLRFENKYDYQIRMDEEMEEDFLMIPPMVVQPFVENAVLHGISPMKAKGNISIDFKLEPDFLKVTIKDNGIGRKRSSEMKMFSKNKSTGIQVTQMRLKHMDARKRVDQTVEIIDLEENGEPAGTMVILRVPILSKDN